MLNGQPQRKCPENPSDLSLSLHPGCRFGAERFFITGTLGTERLLGVERLAVASATVTRGVCCTASPSESALRIPLTCPPSLHPGCRFGAERFFITGTLGTERLLGVERLAVASATVTRGAWNYLRCKRNCSSTYNFPSTSDKQYLRSHFGRLRCAECGRMVSHSQSSKRIRSVRCFPLTTGGINGSRSTVHAPTVFTVMAVATHSRDRCRDA